MIGRIACRPLDNKCTQCGEYLTDDEVSVDMDAIRDMTINHIHCAHYHTDHQGQRCGPVERIVCR